MNNTNLNVALAISHNITRSGLSHTIESFGGYKITLELNDSALLTDSIIHGRCAPDICITNTTPHSIDRVAEIYKEIRVLSPGIKLVAYISALSKVNILKLLNIGVNCLLPEDTDHSELRDALNKLRSESIYYHDSIKNVLTNTSKAVIELNETEMSFISFCCSELTYKEIASRMNMSVRNIEKLRESLFKKFNTVSKTGLVLKALKMQIISIG